VFASLRELCLHQFQCHEVSSMAAARRLEMHTQDTVTESTGQGKRGDDECSDVAVHMCVICSKSFGSKAALSMHLVRVHPKCKLPVISNISESKQAKLTDMPNGQSSSQTDAAEKDADVVRGKQLCNDCGKLFVNIANHKESHRFRFSAALQSELQYWLVW